MVWCLVVNDAVKGRDDEMVHWRMMAVPRRMHSLSKKSQYGILGK
jgi:hypothetical protein